MKSTETSKPINDLYKVKIHVKYTICIRTNDTVNIVDSKRSLCVQYCRVSILCLCLCMFVCLSVCLSSVCLLSVCLFCIFICLVCLCVCPYRSIIKFAMCQNVPNFARNLRCICTLKALSRIHGSSPDIQTDNMDIV